VHVCDHVHLEASDGLSEALSVRELVPHHVRLDRVDGPDFVRVAVDHRIGVVGEGQRRPGVGVARAGPVAGGERCTARVVGVDVPVTTVVAGQPHQHGVRLPEDVPVFVSADRVTRGDTAGTAGCKPPDRSPDVFCVDTGRLCDILGRVVRHVVSKPRECRLTRDAVDGELSEERVRAAGFGLQCDWATATTSDGDDLILATVFEDVARLEELPVSLRISAGAVVRFRRKSSSYVSSSKTVCIIASARCTSLPGSTGSHRSAFDAVVVYTGSTTTSFAPFSIASRIFEASIWN